MPATSFCLLWAATQFLDLLCFPEWVLKPTGIGLFLATVAVLAMPAAPVPFLLMCGLNLAYLYVRSPITPNHALFEGFVNLTIILTVLGHIRMRPLVAARDAGFREAAPILRVLLLALYAFTFLHKLNHDFLSPATSCAAFMLAGLAEQVPIVPTGPTASAGAIAITLLVEGGVPLLLLVPRTRLIAILVAWAFHLVLSFHPRPGIYAFSAMMLTLLTLFLPEAFHQMLERHPTVRRVLDVLGKHRDRLRVVFWTASVVAAAAAVGMMLLGIDLTGRGLTGWSRTTGMVLWLVAATAVPLLLILGWPSGRSGSTGSLIAGALRAPASVMLVLFILNCLAPYLGLQTVRTLSMFSSLRTEGGWTNHLFIPRTWQVAGFQDDLVRPIESSDPWLDFYADNGTLIPYAELRRRVWEDPGRRLQVTFERDGEIETVDTASPDAVERVPPLPVPTHKVLAFRQVDRTPPVLCRW